MDRKTRPNLWIDPPIKRWLAPPIFPDDELKTRRAGLLDPALLVTLALALIVLAGDLIGGRTPTLIVWVEVAAVPVCLVLRYWTHRGRVREASIVLIAAYLIGTTVFCAMLGTLRTPTTAVYLLIVVGAGLVFDANGIIVTTALSSLAVLGLVWAENARLLPAPDSAATITQWIAYTALFGLAGALTWMGLRSARQALERADQQVEERKRTEEELRLSEQYARSIIDSSLDMIVTTDPQRRIVAFNRASQETFGYARDEVIGRDVNLLYADPVEGQDVDRVISELGKDIRVVLNKRKNGQVFACQLSAAAMRDSKGAFLGIVGVSRDFTEREWALRQSEGHFSGAFENAAIGMAVVSPEGRWLRVNRSLCELTGYAEDELLSKTFQDITHPDDVETDLANLHKLLTGDINAYHREKRYIHKSGRVVWILLNASLVRDGRGQPRHFIGQIQDISARKEAEEELRRRAEELAALYDTTRDLARVQDLPGLLGTIVDRATHLLKTSNGGMYIYDAVRGDLVVRVATDASTPVGTRLQMGEGMAGRVAQTRQPLIVDDYRTWPLRSPKYAGTPLSAVMEVPMLFGGELVGVLAVEEVGETARKFTEEDARLLSLFASQAASAVFNAQLLAESTRRADEFAGLYYVAHDLARQRDLPTLLKTIVDRAALLLAANGGGIYLYDDARADLTLVAPKGNEIPAGVRLRLGEGMAGRVAETRQPMLVEDYSQWEHRSPQYEGVPITAVVQVPMLYGGDLIGVLAVHQLETTVRKFTESDVRLLSLFAEQAAGAVHNARLLEEARLRSQRQEALYRISTSLTHLLGARELCERVVQACRDLLIYPFLGIFLLDPSTGDRVLQAHRGWNKAPHDWRLHPGQGLSERPVLSGQLHYTPDVTREPSYVPATPGYRSELDVPIQTSDSVLGVLVVNDPRVDAFGQADFDALQAVANQLAVALENVRLYSEQRQLAITDSLTGQFNRRHFMELAQREFLRAKRQHSPCAVLMIDLNGFKQVNDNFGHAAGDLALRRVAEALARNVRGIDIIARYGGDEFVILLPDCGLGQAQRITDRLHENCQGLQILNEKEKAALSFSIGIAVSTLAPEETLDALLSRADTEMYRAKQEYNESGQEH